MADIREFLKTALRAIAYGGLGGLAFAGVTTLAWYAAPASPPSSNVSAPLNISATAQTKSGTININGAGQLNVLPTSNADWAGDFQSATTYGIYSDNSSNIYSQISTGNYGLLSNGSVNTTLANGVGVWAGYFANSNGDYGVYSANQQGSHGALGQAGYGGVFYGATTGLYATNYTGIYTYLDYGANYGVYSNGDGYFTDVFLASVGKWASAVPLTYGSIVTYSGSGAAYTRCASNYFMIGTYSYAPAAGGYTTTYIMCQYIGG